MKSRYDLGNLFFKSFWGWLWDILQWPYIIQSICGGRGPHSQLGDLHHGQAVRKAVFGRVFRLPERRSLSVTCLAKSLCPKALNTNIASYDIKTRIWFRSLFPGWRDASLKSSHYLFFKIQLPILFALNFVMVKTKTFSSTNLSINCLW